MSSSALLQTRPGQHATEGGENFDVSGMSQKTEQDQVPGRLNVVTANALMNQAPAALWERNGVKHAFNHAMRYNYLDPQ